MKRTEQDVDTGTAYGMPPRTYRKELVEVGPGTPMGELLRRYWQPCFSSADLTSDRPRRVKLLGENLILFRDKSGRPGLVHEHCCHRGTSLYYGRIEEDGVRCCYHGWKFDVQGRCLEQPCEVNKGEQNRHRVRQPWYPVQERYGLVYAYMGPPEKKPVLPRWKNLENLGPDEVLEVRWRPAYGPIKTDYDVPYLAFNWLQTYENTMDAPHLPWLHYHHSGDQFTELKLANTELPPYARYEDLAGAIVAERTERGIRQGVPMPGEGGQMLLACNEAVLPNLVFIPGFVEMAYVIPMDDTSYTNVMIWRSNYQGEKSNTDALHNGKSWWEMSEEEHQRFPGDYEAQASIGKLPAHNREHLSAGDRAVVMLRRRLEEAVKDVQEGRDPPGLIFEPDAPPLETAAFELRPYEAAAE